MKKAALSFLCLFAVLIFGGCGPKEQNKMVSSNKIITFVNDVTDADVWILPKTQENIKTSLWGTATLSKVKTGENRMTPLPEPGDDGLYILRMIDTDSFYYSADGIALESGMTLRVTEKEINSVIAQVSDENGVVTKTYEVFCASL